MGMPMDPAASPAAIDDTASAPRVNPYVFVVGAPRSGTTLLQRMLNHHPALAVANDTHFIPWAIAGSDQGDPEMTDDLPRRVFGYRRFFRFEMPEASVEAAANGASRYSDFVARLYDEYGRLRNKRLAGEKTPEYVCHIPLLHRLFPRARFIHIVRDGRDAALSVLKWAVKDRPPDETGSNLRGPARHPLWEDEPLAATALWWSDMVLEGAVAGEGLGPELYRQVRYEDLVAAPEATIGALARFLDLSDAPEMVKYYEDKQNRRVVGKSAKKAWLPATPGLRNWRTEMSTGDAALFEELAGEALVRFGYPLETAGCDAARAEACRSRWLEGGMS